MRSGNLFILSIGALFGIVASAHAADVNGKWKRPNGTIAEVYPCGGKLCGKIIAGEPTGFEMFHGMAKVGPAKWQGADMKHPSMPGFMTFNGTVTMKGNILKVKGCAIGQSMCDEETWSRVH
jgi:uncharacterized protein (DUF2147 family)